MYDSTDCVVLNLSDSINFSPNSCKNTYSSSLLYDNSLNISSKNLSLFTALPDRSNCATPFDTFMPNVDRHC